MTNILAWKDGVKKRQRYKTLTSLEKSSKKRKLEQSEEKTKVQQGDVEQLCRVSYDVDDPVDFDAANVIVPLNWVCILHYDLIGLTLINWHLVPQCD